MTSLLLNPLPALLPPNINLKYTHGYTPLHKHTIVHTDPQVQIETRIRRQHYTGDLDGAAVI